MIVVTHRATLFPERMFYHTVSEHAHEVSTSTTGLQTTEHPQELSPWTDHKATPPQEASSTRTLPSSEQPPHTPTCFPMVLHTAPSFRYICSSLILIVCVWCMCVYCWCVCVSLHACTEARGRHQLSRSLTLQLMFCNLIYRIYLFCVCEYVSVCMDEHI